MPRHPIPLFRRLFVPNAAVLGVACVVLILAPASGQPDAHAPGYADAASDRGGTAGRLAVAVEGA